MKRTKWIPPVLAALLWALTGATSAPDTTISAAARRASGAPVVFHNDTLLVVHARLGPYSPGERAAAIVSRLTRIARDPRAHIDSLVVSDGETSSDVLSGDRVLLTVTDADAAAAGLPRRRLARVIASSAYAALKAEASETSLRSIVIGGFFALISTIALILAFKLVNRILRKIRALLESWRGTRIPALRIQKLEVLSADRITNMLLGATRVVRIVVYVLLIYLCVPLILSFFPWTRGLATVLFDQILSPLGAIWHAFVGYLPNIFYVAAIVLVTRYILKVVRWFFGEVEKGTITLPNFYRDWSIPTYKIVHVLVVAFAAVVILPYLPGSGSPAFKGVSVFLGVLFSLGSASSISNVVAGVVLTYMRAFEVGDRVKIADTTGDVTEKTLLITRVRTIKNVDVTIPNAMVLGSHIVNFSSSAREQGLILHSAVTISYDVPWKRVHELLIEAAKGTDNVMDKPAPFVLQTSLDDSYVEYEINAYTDRPNAMAQTLSDLHQNIQDRFNEAGVEIMSPHYAAVRDGNRTAIPDQYLPKSYAAPGFRILPLGGRTAGEDPSVK
jgi:small-conductance mechanosensitive channel